MASQAEDKNREVSVSINSSFYHNRYLDLPTVIKEYGRIEDILINLQYIACITIHINELRTIEQLYGSNTYNSMLASITESLKEMCKGMFRSDDVLVVDIYDVDTFIIFLSPPRDSNTRLLNHLEGIANRIRVRLEEYVFTLFYPYLKGYIRPTIGYALEIRNPMINNMRLIMQLTNNAKRMGRFLAAERDNTSRFALQGIIIDQLVTTVFQPIVNLKTLDVIGYEALSRGPKDSEFHNPLLLFLIAGECGLSFEIDRVCRRKALERARNIRTDMKIFVNTLSMTIHDPEFRGAYLEELLEDLKLKPENVVFEVSEKLAIDNYDLFRTAMKDYVDLGIVHAGDDLGTGHSGLERIMELNPGFLKVDMSFTRGIEKSYIKQEIVKAIIALAGKIGSLVIVEGIETKAEYEVVRDLNAAYGQGFLFGRPSETLAESNRNP
jgi:EAL domain-containing protein (putative c-di-GMP-specific phosphodiesterase class I)